MNILDIFRSKKLKQKRSGIRDGETIWCGTCGHQWIHNSKQNFRTCPECGNMAWKYAVEPVR